MLFVRLLRHVIRSGRILVIRSDGSRDLIESGSPGPSVAIRLHRKSLEWTLALNPALTIGEAYMDGTLTVEDGSLTDFLHLLYLNHGHFSGSPMGRLVGFLSRAPRRLQQLNSGGRSRKNVAHHYDLSDDLFEAFLDPQMQYSCAYFEHPDDSLETAQENKIRHLAAKLLLKPDQRILDIGSGWGGLAVGLARFGASEVSGVTLSERQLAKARQRAAAAGVDHRVTFNLQDYRTLDARFDRIVSVGMFEHVGVAYFDTFFRKMSDLLADDGVAVLHSIMRIGGPGYTNPWIRKYIFPGGYIPALSEVLPSIERAGLVVTDIEVLRLHYAETLKHWHRRFRERWDDMAALYDERFCRMWEFYLVASELSFRVPFNAVFQIQIARSLDAVPVTRDYITKTEQCLRTAMTFDDEAVPTSAQ